MAERRSKARGAGAGAQQAIGAVVAIGDQDDAVRPARPRRERWSKWRAAIFLRVLGGTAQLDEALRASGLACDQILDRLDTDAAFQAAWARANKEIILRLDMAMTCRALSGIANPGAKGTAAEMLHSERLGLAMLERLKAAASGAGTGSAADCEDVANHLRAEIAARVKALGRSAKELN